MKKTLTFLLVAIFIFVSIVKSQPVWYPLNTGISVHLADIYFINDNTGFVTSVDTVIKTTNAGVNWTKHYIGTSNKQLYCVRFINSDTGYVTGELGIVMKTTNGGINWFDHSNGFSGHGFELFIMNTNVFFISSDAGKIFKTTNGGDLWFATNTPSSSAHLTSIDFTNNNIGYAVGWTGTQGVYLRTANAGISWTSHNLGTTGWGWNDIRFANSNVGYIIGGNWPQPYTYKILKTTNAGNNWNVVQSGTGWRYGWMYLMNADTVITVGSGGNIYRTMNGGVNWVYIYPGTTNDFYGVFFTSANTGYASGRPGMLLKTTNGLTFVNQINSTTPKNFHLLQNYPNPFNPFTDIKFDIQKTSLTKLIIYDVLGREVEIVVNKVLNAGSYQVNWNASGYPSGVYFYRLQTGDFIETKKMLLLK